jgi:hypothetical protein
MKKWFLLFIFARSKPYVRVACFSLALALVSSQFCTSRRRPEFSCFSSAESLVCNSVPSRFFLHSLGGCRPSFPSPFSFGGTSLGSFLILFSLLQCSDAHSFIVFGFPFTASCFPISGFPVPSTGQRSFFLDSPSAFTLCSK